MAKKRVSLSEKKTRPLDELFLGSQAGNIVNKQDDNVASNQVNNITNKQGDNITSNQNEYIRKTYHLTQEIIDVIAIYASFERKDKSEIVREAIKEYIPEKYFLMVKDIKNNKP